MHHFCAFANALTKKATLALRPLNPHFRDAFMMCCFVQCGQRRSALSVVLWWRISRAIMTCGSESSRTKLNRTTTLIQLTPTCRHHQ